MKIERKFDDSSNSWQVKLEGEIDIYNAPELKEALTNLIDEKQGDIIIDCEDLKYIDSTGLGVLISILKKVKEYDGVIKITNLKPYINKIFTITGLDKIFIIEAQR
ncbi:MAG TPA: STAS domain-containing protein [Clostridiales bacterium]|nr:STAS domain-containing protein [Clostridiales bacterium]